MLSDIEGGVLLETPLGGFRYWNVENLELASKPKTTLAMGAD